MVITEKMKKEVVEMMKDSKDKDLNKSYKFIEELPLESFKSVVKILNETKEANEVDKNIKLNRELYLQNQKANPDDTI